LENLIIFHLLIIGIEEVKGLFQSIDVDKDGLLSKEEMMTSPGRP